MIHLLLLTALSIAGLLTTYWLMMLPAGEIHLKLMVPELLDLQITTDSDTIGLI